MWQVTGGFSVPLCWSRRFSLASRQPRSSKNTNINTNGIAYEHHHTILCLLLSPANYKFLSLIPMFSPFLRIPLTYRFNQQRLIMCLLQKKHCVSWSGTQKGSCQHLPIWQVWARHFSGACGCCNELSVLSLWWLQSGGGYKILAVDNNCSLDTQLPLIIAPDSFQRMTSWHSWLDRKSSGPECL